MSCAMIFVGSRLTKPKYNRPEMNSRTTRADGSRLVHVSPVQDAFIRKLAQVTERVLAADPADIPPHVLEAARDAHALWSETRS